MVEGYCSGRLAEQLQVSRARAILVRRYLQNQFQLDSSNLGIVAIKSLPPNGVGRATWERDLYRCAQEKEVNEPHAALRNSCWYGLR